MKNLVGDGLTSGGDAIWTGSGSAVHLEDWDSLWNVVFLDGKWAQLEYAYQSQRWSVSLLVTLNRIKRLVSDQHGKKGDEGNKSQ